MNKTAKKKPGIGLAFVPIISMFGLLGIGIGLFGLPAEPLILVAAVIAGAVAMYLGYSFDDIMESVSEKIGDTMPALLILIIVGLMIGSWMIGGTIPMMIYYGLKIINPSYLFLTALIVTSIITVLTGTSWGSAGTIGVAFMGVGIAMDVNLGIVAGAVVSGAYFGDKISPLSDTTNLAAVSTGVDLYDHIRNQLWTTVPSYVVAMVVYIFAGRSLAAGSQEIPVDVTLMMESLNNMFNFNILYIIPVLVVLLGAIFRKPTIPVMLLASFIGIINALVFEGQTLANVFSATMDGFNVSMVGLTETEVIPDVVTLLSRGGMVSMMSVLLIAILAITFAGTMTVTGSLDVIIEKLLTYVDSTFKLIATTILVSLVTIGVTSNGQVSILLPGESFRDAYIRMGVHPNVLARTIEDSVTVIEPLLPWTSAGAYMAGTLGVMTVDYLPWATFNYLGIVFALILAATGIGITKIDPETFDK